MGKPALSFVFVLVLATAALGADVAVFDNGLFVDTTGGPFSESDTVQVSLTALGHTVSTFTGFTATDWTTAGAANDLILIPELENGNLFGSLNAAAQTALANYVAGGGGLVVMGSSGNDVILLNGLFGWALVATAPVMSVPLDGGVASGTPFAGGPPILVGNATVYGVFRATLPVGAFDVYHDPTLHNVIFGHGVGSGQVVRVGWDWYNAVPMGSVDGGWIDALNRSVSFSMGLSKALPEPSTWALFGLGILGLGGYRLRRRRRA